MNDLKCLVKVVFKLLCRGYYIQNNIKSISIFDKVITFPMIFNMKLKLLCYTIKFVTSSFYIHKNCVYGVVACKVKNFNDKLKQSPKLFIRNHN